jgi:SAM-dependent methyltransferase
MNEIAKLYRDRFERSGLQRRNRVWKVLCGSYFSAMIPKNATVLEVACGYGEFINNIQAAHKFAIDINPDSAQYLAPDVSFSRIAATDLACLGVGLMDVVFTSNFLEHLRDKTECDQVLAAVSHVLRPGGKFIIMGPNIRYAHREFWDFYDHHLPLCTFLLRRDFGLPASISRRTSLGSYPIR